MSIPAANSEILEDNGHPPALFILFFTEMWERFSYYGMRALLVLFLTSSLMDGGWAWERKEALTLYAWYTGLVYLTPILGGLIADKLLGYRKAVMLGALIMTIGHASMAMESSGFFYLGLSCLIIGNGLFKPNISSIVGQLYTHHPEKKRWSIHHILYGNKCRCIFGNFTLRVYRGKGGLELWFWIGRYIYVFRLASVFICTKDIRQHRPDT